MTLSYSVLQSPLVSFDYFPSHTPFRLPGLNVLLCGERANKKKNENPKQKVLFTLNFSNHNTNKALQVVSLLSPPLLFNTDVQKEKLDHIGKQTDLDSSLTLSFLQTWTIFFSTGKKANGWRYFPWSVALSAWASVCAGSSTAHLGPSQKGQGF